MKCPKCRFEMVSGHVMVMAGSGLRWYNQEEKQHKMLGVLGGQLIVEARPCNEYLPAYRCYDCDSVFVSLNTGSGGFDRAAIDKAR
jgi:hypothetical protein